MALTKINNNTLSAVTTLPSAIATGKVLQVVSATDSTERASTSSSYVTASNTLSVDITPSSTSSKIFIFATTTGHANTSASFRRYTIYRDATNLGGSNGMQIVYNENSADIINTVSLSYLDSPNSTSEITYQLYGKTASGSVYFSKNGVLSSITAYEIAG